MKPMTPRKSTAATYVLALYSSARISWETMVK